MVISETRLTDQVPLPAPAYTGETYYGLPALKPGHYGWLITSYFFVGGLASAAQFLATVIDLFGESADHSSADGDRSRASDDRLRASDDRLRANGDRLRASGDRSLVRCGRYLALLGGLVSPPLLILDLNTPQRWYNMLRIFRKTSAMSIGSWALTAFGMLSGLAAFGQALEDIFHWPAGRWLARLAGLPAALAAGIVAIYTGTLLAATNIPLWSGGFPVLSSLFASSAASTAVAALTLLNPRAGEHSHRRLAWFGLVAGLSELFFAARVDRHWRAHQVDTPVRRAPLQPLWRGGVWGLGILIPLALHLVQLLGGRKARRVVPRRPGEAGLASPAGYLASAAALVGGFCLRAVFIFGGRQSARRPRDYFRQSSAGQ